MDVTFRQARLAYEALRAMDMAVGPDGKPAQAFAGKLSAKYKAIQLQQALKLAYDVSNDRLQQLVVTHTENVDGKAIFKDVLAYRKAEQGELSQEVPGGFSLTLNASDIGESALDVIPASLLVDLGPFLTWDLKN
jgi:hypothetical protein